MYLKRYTNRNVVLVAACDEDIVGRTFTQDGLRLHVDEKFYVGESVGEEKMLEEIHNADISNLVGERVVRCAIEAGEVLAGSVLYIDGVPHAQIARL
ncbi:MAG: DUF424 domain-containing protein [Methermicoccaceae archaeon]